MLRGDFRAVRWNQVTVTWRRQLFEHYVLRDRGSEGPLRASCSNCGVMLHGARMSQKGLEPFVPRARFECPQRAESAGRCCLPGARPAASPHDRFEPSAVIEAGGGAAYVRPATDGDLCTEASIDPQVAASLGTWMPTLFA